MGTAEAPEWTTVMGVTDFKPPMPDPNIEDSSDDAVGGLERQHQDGPVLGVDHDPEPQGQRPGQDVPPDPREAAPRGLRVRLRLEVDSRWFDREGYPEAYEGTGIVKWEESGGEHTALGQVEITITGDGKITPITNPIA
ncbi:hypothetical protein SCALM49S_04581 [Streptomyces californicus]